MFNFEIANLFLQSNMLFLLQFLHNNLVVIYFVELFYIKKNKYNWRTFKINFVFQIFLEISINFTVVLKIH